MTLLSDLDDLIAGRLTYRVVADRNELSIPAVQRRKKLREAEARDGRGRLIKVVMARGPQRNSARYDAVRQTLAGAPPDGKTRWTRRDIAAAPRVRALGLKESQIRHILRTFKRVAREAERKAASAAAVKGSGQVEAGEAQG